MERNFWDTRTVHCFLVLLLEDDSPLYIMNNFQRKKNTLILNVQMEDTTNDFTMSEFCLLRRWTLFLERRKDIYDINIVERSINRKTRLDRF